MSSTEAPFSLALRTVSCSNQSRVLRSSAIASREPKDSSVFSARRRRERGNVEPSMGGRRESVQVLVGHLTAIGTLPGADVDSLMTTASFIVARRTVSIRARVSGLIGQVDLP